jgi:hypothetical protein
MLMIVYALMKAC